jgi:hypothetical protein
MSGRNAFWNEIKGISAETEADIQHLLAIAQHIAYTGN